jgi:hypothetical protein
MQPLQVTFLTSHVLPSTGELPPPPAELHEEASFDVQLAAGAEGGDERAGNSSDGGSDSEDAADEPFGEDWADGEPAEEHAADGEPPEVPSVEADADMARRLALGLHPDHWLKQFDPPSGLETAPEVRLSLSCFHFTFFRYALLPPFRALTGPIFI